MITNEKKIQNAKNTIKNYIIFSSIYIAIFIAAIIDTLIITPNEGIRVFSGTMIVLYLFLGLSLIVFILNIHRYSNPETIRRKAIDDYDERNILVLQKANSLTLQFVTFALIIGLLLGLYFNSVEVFMSCLVLFVLIMMAHIVIKFIVNRKL